MRLLVLLTVLGRLPALAFGQAQTFRKKVRDLTARKWFEKRHVLWNGTKYTDPQQAIAYYSEALRLDPSYAGAYVNPSNARTYLGQLERTIEDLDRALHLDPKLALSYPNRGVAYGRLGQVSRAYLDMRKACELENQASCDFLRTNPE